MKKRTTMKVVTVCIILVLILVIMYSGLRILESTVFFKDQQEPTLPSKVVSRDGQRYFLRQDVTVMMVLGIEYQGKVADYTAVHDYPADMITLLIFDELTEECTLLCINRDTMATMPRLDDNGKEEGTAYAQIALSHNFGTGREDSCENTKKTVSRLLGGVTIDHYFAMNTDAIALLNDAVGGVSVNVTDDFSQVDPDIKMGQMTLSGKQALTYVQARRFVSDQLNLSRIDRQMEYMKGFVSALRTKASSSSSGMLKVYNAAAEYVVTDCSVSVLNRLLEDYGNYSLNNVLLLPGENVLGESHYEFYVDEEAADELILQLFYKPID